jgi:hypothetical protein
MQHILQKGGHPAAFLVSIGRKQNLAEVSRPVKSRTGPAAGGRSSRDLAASDPERL